MPEMMAHGLAQLALDREERIEARHRILEDRSDIPPRHDARRAARAGVERPAGYRDGSRRRMRPGVCSRPISAVADRGLARAGFADRARGSRRA